MSRDGIKETEGEPCERCGKPHCTIGGGHPSIHKSSPVCHGNGGWDCGWLPVDSNDIKDDDDCSTECSHLGASEGGDHGSR